MTHYVKIAAFTYPAEVSILKHLLEQEEIRFFFQNETIIGVLPFHSHALGGILLKVHRDDILKAKKILDEFQDNPDLQSL